MPLIATLADNSDRVDDACLHGTFPIDRQRQLVLDTVELMGFDPASWRIDDAVHPFATGFGSRDVRITTRWDRDVTSPPGCTARCTSAATVCTRPGSPTRCSARRSVTVESLGLHESQSRLWENMVGRGRPFCGVLAPTAGRCVRRHARRTSMRDTLYRAVNRVQPSFIRVEADEATYGLHIVLRFELEQELIDGTLVGRTISRRHGTPASRSTSGSR